MILQINAEFLENRKNRIRSFKKEIPFDFLPVGTDVRISNDEVGMFGVTSVVRNEIDLSDNTATAILEVYIGKHDEDSFLKTIQKMNFEEIVPL